MRREGVVGVIHEATYPPSTPDFAYGGRQNAALDAGLLWGAYHYANATNPTRQADHFLDVVTANWRRSGGPSGSPGVLLVLDFEKNGHYPGGTMGVGQAADFVERIRSRTGRYPGLYSGENRIKQVLNEPGLDPGVKRSLQNCWLWVANYHYVPTATAPWTRWHLWQYTGDGICDLPRLGFPTSVANLRNVERNLFNGSAKDLLGFWQANAWRP
ncbi:MAG: hypothetical protein QOE70_4685 [Chthoniobacter sp.]|nr:hypothetical protein [Chthoniobacter sp.]